jgi:hypothetical protein
MERRVPSTAQPPAAEHQLDPVRAALHTRDQSFDRGPMRVLGIGRTDPWEDLCTRYP